MNKNHMIISIDAKRESIWQNSTSIHDKKQCGYRGDIAEHDKGHIWEAHS